VYAAEDYLPHSDWNTLLAIIMAMAGCDSKHGTSKTVITAL